MNTGFRIGGLPIYDAHTSAAARTGLKEAQEWIQDHFAPIKLNRYLLDEMVDAMIHDDAPHDFETVSDFADNLKLRYYVVSVMSSIISGRWDYSYFEPNDHTPPVLGSCNNRRSDVKDKDKYWRHPSADRSGHVYIFEATDADPAEVVDHTFPFRGECMGAHQLSVLHGAKFAMGDEAYSDFVTAMETPVFVGSAAVPPGLLGTGQDGSQRRKRELTLVSKFLVGCPHPKQGNKIHAVPGDYFYFRNVPQYPKFSPNGAWRGENSVYLGRDFMGYPRFSGMGLGYETPFTMAQLLVKGAFFDCNAAFVKSFEAGDKNADRKFHPFYDLNAVKISARALIRTPKPTSEPKVITSGTIPEGPKEAPTDMVRRLESLGLAQGLGDTWEGGPIRCGALVSEVGLEPRALVEANGSSFLQPDYQTRVGDWQFEVRPEDPDDNPAHPDTELRVLAVRSENPEMIRADG